MTDLEDGHSEAIYIALRTHVIDNVSVVIGISFRGDDFGSHPADLFAVPVRHLHRMREVADAYISEARFPSVCDEYIRLCGETQIQISFDVSCWSGQTQSSGSTHTLYIPVHHQRSQSMHIRKRRSHTADLTIMKKTPPGRPK